MRYRKLDANGDYTFGRSAADFYVDSPEAVAQSIATRLRLFVGEWFLDTTVGTEPPAGQTPATYTQAIRDRIVGTAGVKTLDSYQATYDAASRTISISAIVTTDYGQLTVTETL